MWTERDSTGRHVTLRAQRFVIASASAAASFFIPAVVISAALHVALVPYLAHDRIFKPDAPDETVVVSRFVIERARPKGKPPLHPTPKVRPSLAPAVPAQPIVARTGRRPKTHAVLQVPAFRNDALPPVAMALGPPIAKPPSVAVSPKASSTPRAVLAAAPSVALSTLAPIVAAAPLAVPTCAQPFSEAHMLAKVVPRRPAIAEQQQAFGTAQIEVDLDERGDVQRASIYVSAQNPALDAAARDAALRSTYAPRIVNCRPTGGRYVYIVDFSPQ
jgi:TonB family protein